MTWPLDTNAYARTSTKHDVIGTGHVAASLNHSVRVIVAGEKAARQQLIVCGHDATLKRLYTT